MRWILALLLGSFLLFGVLPAVYDQIRPPRTDVELARTARTAVELAREVSQQSASRGGDGDHVWMLAIVLGTSVPLVVAYLIWRAADHHEPGGVELLAVAARHELLQLPDRSFEPGTAELPDSTGRPILPRERS